MSDRSCQIVGSWCRINQAKNMVRSGSMLLWAFALVTLILWIPSIHKIFDRPKRRTPLIIKNNSESCIFWNDIGVWIIRAIVKRAIVLKALLTNIIVSLDTCFLALWVKKLPNGAIALAIRISMSPIWKALKLDARTINAPTIIKKEPATWDLGICSLLKTWKKR